jgi:hypothetical protein
LPTTIVEALEPSKVIATTISQGEFGIEKARKTLGSFEAVEKLNNKIIGRTKGALTEAHIFDRPTRGAGSGQLRILVSVVNFAVIDIVCVQKAISLARCGHSQCGYGTRWGRRLLSICIVLKFGFDVNRDNILRRRISHVFKSEKN